MQIAINDSCRKKCLFQKSREDVSSLNSLKLLSPSLKLQSLKLPIINVDQDLENTN